ncbi:MAG: hypothetical protein ACPL3C_10380 [Pyrobaculum sp.]
MRVADLLGASVYTLRRYGVEPDDDLETAVRKLIREAPHLAELVRAAARRASIELAS